MYIKVLQCCLLCGKIDVGGEKMIEFEEQCMSTTMQGQKSYELKHIAHNTGKHIETIRRNIASGKLKAYRCGKLYYVVESDYMKWVRGEV